MHTKIYLSILIILGCTIWWLLVDSRCCASVRTESHCRLLSGSCFSKCVFLTYGYGLGTFHTVAFALNLRASEPLYEPFKSMFSISYCSMALLHLITIDFQNQAYGGLVALVSDPRVRVPDVGHSPLSPQGKVPSFGERFLIVGHRVMVGSQVRLSISLSHLDWCISFILCCRDAAHLVLRSFSEGNYSMCSCTFVVSMPGGECRVFLGCHLETLCSNALFNIQGYN